ncbi:CRTAC1 family protein [Thalassotalea litorea]|uniref:CRTAC1 family protein n=1 Tax=Thalassotalea litorea TaxID=2020715 RepID=A0A5R9IL30_9GAMM|nr:CRTAC1 family protein [Thalassotalea litorea]TLU65173.1 CRTAC1 family protein [Thalassotalea litorea]
MTTYWFRTALALLAVSYSLTSAQVKADSKPPMFIDISDSIGLAEPTSWKYGGPSVADVDQDGRLDFVLPNHDQHPAYLYFSQKDNTLLKHQTPIGQWDAHGIAPGDYDGDGDLDFLVSLGGGNGSQPQPPRLLKNQQGKFVDITVQAGIADMGARGRSVRWLDLDADGDLDFLQINATQIQGEKGPRNILFENLGNDTFKYRPSPVFEQMDAERVFITDLNDDGRPDLLGFAPYTPLVILQASSNFSFSDVTHDLLPSELSELAYVNAIAEADVNNDGLMDYYLARGKALYQIANNSIEYDQSHRRLDLRDEGNKSQDGVTFTGDRQVYLSDFYHFPRDRNVTALPLYLGKDKMTIAEVTDMTAIKAKQAQGFPNQLDKTGWYLGYLGQNQEGKHQWRLAWHLASNVAWDIRASVIGVDSFTADFDPQTPGIADVLLMGEAHANAKNKKPQVRFADASHRLPPLSKDNNQGVITGDFDNDGRSDFFVYRFGTLTQRQADVLMLNQGKRFNQNTEHGATHLPAKAHGDMGAAFDFNLDGKIDILSGDDDNGRWHLFANQLQNQHNFIRVEIGYSVNNIDAIDPIGAKVTLVSATSTQTRFVNSQSASHSQSLINTLHFGLGEDESVEKIVVQWRDGSIQEINDITINQQVFLGQRLIAPGKGK